MATGYDMFRWLTAEGLRRRQREDGIEAFIAPLRPIFPAILSLRVETGIFILVSSLAVHLCNVFNHLQQYHFPPQPRLPRVPVLVSLTWKQQGLVN